MFKKITSLILTFVMTLGVICIYPMGTVHANEDTGLELEKIIYANSTLDTDEINSDNEVNIENDAEIDTSTVITSPNKYPAIKLVFNEELNCDYKDKLLDDTTIIKAIDNSGKNVDGFSATYNSETKSIDIDVSSYDVSQDNNPYYLVLTDQIKSNDKNFVPKVVFDGKLAEGGKELLLPFNFDTEKPGCTIMSGETSISTEADDPTVLEKENVIEFKFSESMRIFNYKIDDEYDFSRNISFEEKQDDGQYKAINLEASDFNANEENIKFFLSGDNYKNNKEYHIKISKYNIEDLAGNGLNYDVKGDYYFKIQGDTPVLNSTLSPNSIVFSKTTPSATQIEMNLNGNNLVDIKEGEKALEMDTDYSVSENVVTISEDYLKEKETGKFDLTFVFDKGNPATLAVIITEGEEVTIDSTITPSKAEFDKTNPKDIEVAMNLNGNSFMGIKNGEDELASGTDYSVDKDKVTIKSDYLDQISEGTLKLSFKFDKGNDAELLITIKDDSVIIIDSTITPTKAEFDKANPKDIEVSMSLNGNSLTGIKNVKEGLQLDKDYSISGDRVTIKSDYLKEKAVGSLNLTFIFNQGNNAKLELTIKDSSMVINDPIITPSTAEFDEGDPKDIVVTMNPNGNTLLKLKVVLDLKPGEDYVVSGNEVTIKKEYLSTRTFGSETTIIFMFSNNKTAELKVKMLRSSTITNYGVNYKRNEPNDIELSVNYNGNTLEYIKTRDTGYMLIEGEDYTLKDDKILLKQKFLNTLPLGYPKLVFHFNHGKDDDLTITVQTISSELITRTAEFDKENPSDVELDIKANGNGILEILNDDYTLKLGKDYSFNSTKLVFKKEYLNKLENGENYFELKFDDDAYGPKKHNIIITISGNVENSIVEPSMFKFYRKTPQDLTVGIYYNGNKLLSIKDGDYTLAVGKDYETTATGVLIKKEYFNSLPNGIRNLCFYFDRGTTAEIKVEISEKEIKNSIINPRIIDVDRKNIEDCTIEMQLNENEFKEINDGSVKLVEGKDYTLEGNIVTLKKEYIEKLAIGETKLYFHFSEGQDAKLVINVMDKLPELSHTLINFYKENPEDFVVGLENNGYELSSIEYDGKVLVQGTDYVISDGEIVLKKEFLSTLEEGYCKLIFKFTGDKECVLTVNVLASNKFIIRPSFDSTSIKLGYDAKLVFNINNCSKDSEMVTFIVGLYDSEDKLIDYTALVQEMKSYENIEIAQRLSMPEEGKYTIKCFVCDNVEEMKPQSEIIEIAVK